MPQCVPRPRAASRVCRFMSFGVHLVRAWQCQKARKIKLQRQDVSSMDVCHACRRNRCVRLLRPRQRLPMYRPVLIRKRFQRRVRCQLQLHCQDRRPRHIRRRKSRRKSAVFSSGSSLHALCRKTTMLIWKKHRMVFLNSPMTT